MANPYHDETGKFCEKNEMFTAVLRLQSEGRSEEATRLFIEYKDILARTGQERSETAIRDDIEKFGTTVSATPVRAGTQRAIADLKEFIFDNKLEMGTVESKGWMFSAMEEKVEQMWKDNPRPSLSNYDPKDPYHPQLLYTFYNVPGDNPGEYGLIAYKNGLYISEVPAKGLWGQIGSYTLTPADPFPSAPDPDKYPKYLKVPTRQDDSWAEDTADAEASRWAEETFGTASKYDEEAEQEKLRTGKVILLDTINQTVDAGHDEYRDISIFQDSETGLLYQRTVIYSSWDEVRNDPRTPIWERVEKTDPESLKPTFHRGTWVDEDESWG